jgi:hypothetical protein
MEVGGEVLDRALVSDPCESIEKMLQFVGLIVKFGRSMLTWIDRMRIGTPPMMLGTVSDTAFCTPQS